jgi:hypothetical protein
MSEIQGKVIAVLPTQSGNGKNGEWVKIFFVIEFLENQHPVQLCMEVFGADKWDKMKQNIVVNNQVNVRYSVSSHEYNGRWFTSCQCYYCASTFAGQGQQRPSPAQASQQPQGEQQSGDGDNLPF